MQRSWRSVATSRRSRRFSCSTVSPGTAAPPPDASRCWRAHARNWSGRTSSSRPTWANVSPAARRTATNRTASALNSALKSRRSRRAAFRFDFMCHLRPEIRASKASTKSGQLHFPANAGNRDAWVSPWQFGINQGPIVLMIENHRTGFAWRLMRACPYISSGLRRPGFAGGWL